MDRFIKNGTTNPNDIIKPINVSLKHIVKYKTGNAFYFITEIYNVFNRYYDKGKNRIFVKLKRVLNKDSVDDNEWFVELTDSFSNQFNIVDFNEISIEERKNIIKNHKIDDQVKWINLGHCLKIPVIDDNKIVEFDLKTIDDIDAYIVKERNRTDLNSILTNNFGWIDTILGSNWSVGCSFGTNDIITTNNWIRDSVDWNDDYSMRINKLTINETIGDENPTLILKSNKRKSKVVVVKEDQTIIL